MTPDFGTAARMLPTGADQRTPLSGAVTKTVPCSRWSVLRYRLSGMEAVRTLVVASTAVRIDTDRKALLVDGASDSLSSNVAYFLFFL